MCHYHTGNDQARRSVEQAQGLLDLLGVDAGRLALVEMQPGDGLGFVTAVNEFVEMPTVDLSEGRM
jgi:coenzyme F420-reducing hydrogenase delta subunit